MRYLRLRGMVKLGEARIPASELQPLFGGAPFLTRAAHEADLDWAAWGVTPLPKPPAQPEAAAGRSGGEASWSRLRGVLGLLAAPHRHELAAHAAASPPRGVLGGRGAAPLLRSLSGRAPLPPAPGSLGGLAPPPSLVVEAFVVGVRDAAAPGPPGLLFPLMRRWQMGSCPLAAFGLPAVQAVVAWKWNAFARRLLLRQLAAYGLWLGGFSGFLIAFNADDAHTPTSRLLETWKVGGR